MHLIEIIWKTTLDAAGRWFNRLRGRAPQHVVDGALVPICALGPEHTAKIKIHLRALNERDRYLRFGMAMSDAHIDRYVDGLDFKRDDIYGIFNSRLQLAAMAHLAMMELPSGKKESEFGVSVLPDWRSRGYGARLFERAAMHARNQGAFEMMIHALSENAPMISIARKFGGSIEREGSETQAFVRLPDPTLESRLTELVADQFSHANYEVKEQVKQFWDVMGGIQEVRQAVRAGRHQSAQ